VAYHKNPVAKPDNRRQKHDSFVAKMTEICLPYSLHTEFVCINSEKTLSGYQIKRSGNKILGTRGK